MATFRLSCVPAKPSGYGGWSLVYDLTGKPDPMPRRVVEARTAAEAIAHLDAYKAEAAAMVSETVAVSIRVIAGRAPNGWNKAKADLPFVDVVHPATQEATDA